MELETNKKKTVSFEIELSGADPSTLKGFLRLSLNGIEYGIPATITNKTILIDIPILKDVIGKNVEQQKSSRNSSKKKRKIRNQNQNRISSCN